jgi:transposase-like protein
MTFFEFLKKFPTELACTQHYIKIRYGNKVKCNHCKCENSVYHIEKHPKNFICHNCNNTFSVFKDTIFEKSCTDLRKWMYAIHLFLNGKKGISALQLKKEIGVTYKTAWRMLQKIREAMGNDDNDSEGGFVEVDECYIGGKAENKHMYERIKAKTLINEINKNIKEGSIVITDEHKGYHSVSSDYQHCKVNHSQDEYSREESFENREKGYTKFKVHTNTIESFWATLKRGIYGISHYISNKYNENYIAEFCFRYNNRMNENVFDLVLSKSILSK